jgi:hypothetical protein
MKTEEPMDTATLRTAILHYRSSILDPTAASGPFAVVVSDTKRFVVVGTDIPEFAEADILSSAILRQMPQILLATLQTAFETRSDPLQAIANRIAVNIVVSPPVDMVTDLTADEYALIHFRRNVDVRRDPMPATGAQLRKSSVFEVDSLSLVPA